MRELIPLLIFCFSGTGLKTIPFKDQELNLQSVGETKWDGRNQPGSVVEDVPWSQAPSLSSAAALG